MVYPRKDALGQGVRDGHYSCDWAPVTRLRIRNREGLVGGVETPHACPAYGQEDAVTRQTHGWAAVFGLWVNLKLRWDAT